MKRLFTGLAAAACASALFSVAWAASDRVFIRQAMEAENSLIRVASLAEQRAAGADVRDFARTLRQDYTLAKDQSFLVARQLGAPPTDAVAHEARKEMETLGRLKGRAFDAEFMRYIVRDHHRVMTAFQKQAAQGKGSARRLAEQALPTLRKHLFRAQQLQPGR